MQRDLARRSFYMSTLIMHQISLQSATHTDLKTMCDNHVGLEVAVECCSEYMTFLLTLKLLKFFRFFKKINKYKFHFSANLPFIN